MLHMLEVFQRHVASFVQNVFSVPNVCCKRFDLDVAYVSHICSNSMFKMFHLFQPYIAASVFMLQVASVLSGCCICFTHMLQVYVLNISCVFRRMLHSSVSCCKCLISCYSESHGGMVSDGRTARVSRDGTRRATARTPLDVLSFFDDCLR